MKIEVTKAQLESIIENAADLIAMSGSSDDDTDVIWKRRVRTINNMLIKNGMKDKVIHI